MFCAKCGTRLDGWNNSPATHIQEEHQVSEWEEEKDRTWWYVCGAVLAALLVGLGIWGWQSGWFGGSQEQNQNQNMQNAGNTSYVVAETVGRNGLCKLKGSIGKYGVEMMINIDNNAVTGLLHYNSQRKGTNLILKGDVDEDGKMTIYEFAPLGENTGRFNGVFDGETFNGTFRNLNHGKTFSFALTSVTSLSNLSKRDFDVLDEENVEDWENDNRRSVVEENDEEYYDEDNSIVSKQVFTANGVSFTMIGVKGGTFSMGCSKSEDSYADPDESPTHLVTLDSYYIGETEVTQELWEAVMDDNPSEFQYDILLPIEFVSWEDCDRFIRRLNNITQKTFRFPTEAEWEYAARGGHKSIPTTFAGSNNISAVGWFNSNSGGMTHPVKSKSPNSLGLYDMSGNLWEWCQDWMGSYSSEPSRNPKGPYSGSSKVLRGGAWNGGPKNCRLSNRDGRTTDYASNRLGLRLALSK